MCDVGSTPLTHDMDDILGDIAQWRSSATAKTAQVQELLERKSSCSGHSDNSKRAQTTKARFRNHEIQQLPAKEQPMTSGERAKLNCRIRERLLEKAAAQGLEHIPTRFAMLDRKTNIHRRTVCTEFENGDKQIRRTVCTEFENGDKLFAEGDPGRERGVRFEFSNGDKQIYDGSRGLERLVRVEWADGDISLYDGPRGNEQELDPSVPRTVEVQMLLRMGGTLPRIDGVSRTRGKSHGSASLSPFVGSSATSTASSKPRSSLQLKPLDVTAGGWAASVPPTATEHTAQIVTPSPPPQDTNCSRSPISSPRGRIRAQHIIPGLLSRVIAQARSPNAKPRPS